MKTPIRELLKLESELTHMFDSEQRVAMALLEHIRANGNEMLEEENNVITGAFNAGYTYGFLKKSEVENNKLNT